MPLAPFDPVPPLRSAHLQTLWPALFRRIKPPSRRRERLELPDGDFIDIDWHQPDGLSDTSPVCILLHGLTGSSSSHYMLALQFSLGRCGWLVAAVNFRGCSGIPNRLPGVYHAGHTADIQTLLERLRQRLGRRFIAAVGFSLGGSMLANWLGQKDDGDLLQAACLVSVPLRLGLCSTRLDQGFSRLYRHHLLGNLATFFERKTVYFEALGDRRAAATLRNLGDLRRHRSFWTFDDRVMAPLHGFQSVDDYYARCSAAQYLWKITTPTLLVQAIDDPFVPPAALPDPQSTAPAVHCLISPHGGHLGFMGHRAGDTNFGVGWLETTLCTWLMERRAGDKTPTQGLPGHPSPPSPS